MQESNSKIKLFLKKINSNKALPKLTKEKKRKEKEKDKA